MSVQIVLKLGDPQIKGESIVGLKGGGPKHAEEIDVISWSWGITQTGTASKGTGGGHGSADVHDLTITKYADKSSPTIASACFNGSELKTAVLSCVKTASGTPGSPKVAFDFITITMKGTVMVSSFAPGGAGSDERFTETITLHFSEVEYQYTPQTEQNAPGSPIPSGTMAIGT